MRIALNEIIHGVVEMMEVAKVILGAHFGLRDSPYHESTSVSFLTVENR